jgi:hypothetical protein
VRAEDKQLEGQDLEREQRVEASREHAIDELPTFAGEEVRDVALDHRSRLFDALQLVLAGAQIDLELLYLPQRETQALDAVRTAVGGRDSLGEFVFAEDRRSLLEQALAVLQQNLTHGEPAQLAALQGKFDMLTSQVGELRTALTDLADAQEEREDFHQAAKPGAAGETADAAKPKPRPGKPGKPEDARLDGEERPQPAPVPSTLDGPARADPPRPPSTLGDPAELAEAAARLPWWKRRRGG